MTRSFRDVATQLRRDLTMDLDDDFAIIIDPTLSHRNGYIFEVNPLGTSATANRRRAGAAAKRLRSWTRVGTGSGFRRRRSPTTAGPRRSRFLQHAQFSRRHGGQLGAELSALYSPQNEEDIWSGFQRIFGFWRVSQAGLLRGMKEIGSGRLLVIKPYGLLGGEAFSGQPGERCIA